MIYEYTKSRYRARQNGIWLCLQVKSIDDTSNFDDFPEVDLKIREFFISLPKSSFRALVREKFFIFPTLFEAKSGYMAWIFSFGNLSKSPRFENHCHFSLSAAPSNNDTGQPYKDWVFINYTFKRFEGLTQRGPPIKMAKEVVAQTPKWSEGSLLHFWSCKMIRRLSFAKFARWQQKNFLKQKWGNVATEWSLEIWKQNQFEIYNMIFTQKKTWSENHEKMQSPPLCIALLDSELSIIVIFFKLEQQSR